MRPAFIFDLAFGDIIVVLYPFLVATCSPSERSYEKDDDSQLPPSFKSNTHS